ncbi:MAG TPA: WecB/TagA/CpsF family glycosyltransferase [Verrucomicrobiae bacterium]|jgi:N-acetylglucosaminyldiphosphoundecaprenol N-acetyl-beta-D-mannosaminyltransferase
MAKPDPKIQRLVPSQPPIAILGVPFDNVTAGEALTAIEQMVASRQPHYLVTANVDFLVQAQTDVELRRILTDAHLVLCDGTPLLWASRLLGNRLPERVAGSDLAPVLLKVAAQKKYRVFLLGASPDSVEEAAARLKRGEPSLELAGYYSPPFSGLLEMDHEEIKRRVREAQPDILFVAFGCPKAEKWMAMHYRELGVPVVAGVGATIDFLAGRVKRAPEWMRHAGLEWVFRLACEPRRLFRRYMKDLWVFGWRIAAQWLLLQCLPRLASKKSPARAERWWDHTRWAGRHCITDLSGLRFIDSTDAGILLSLRKKLRATGRQFVLASASPGVQRSLALMGLKDYFAIAPDPAAAELIIQARTLEESSAVTGGGSDDASRLAWRGEITAANAGEVWNHTRDLLAGAGKPSPVAIDLSCARFIDSSGLTIMVRAQQWAWRQGTKLVFTGAQPAVRDVLRAAKLDRLLLEPSAMSA